MTAFPLNPPQNNLSHLHTCLLQLFIYVYLYFLFRKMILAVILHVFIQWGWHMHVTMCVCRLDNRVCSVLLPCECQRSRSGPAAWRQAPIHTKPSYWLSLYLYLTEENWVLALDEALAFKGIWWLFWSSIKTVQAFIASVGSLGYDLWFFLRSFSLHSRLGCLTQEMHLEALLRFRHASLTNPSLV